MWEAAGDSLHVYVTESETEGERERPLRTMGWVRWMGGVSLSCGVRVTQSLTSCLPWGSRSVRLGAAQPLCSRKEVWSWTLSPATCSLTSFLPECLETLGRLRRGPHVRGLEAGKHPAARASLPPPVSLQLCGDRIGHRLAPAPFFGLCTPNLLVCGRPSPTPHGRPGNI